MSTFEEIKKEVLVTLEQILPSKKQPSKLKGRKLEPKYKDPVSGKTWAGRGRLPAFLQGKDKEQYRIAENGTS